MKAVSIVKNDIFRSYINNRFYIVRSTNRNYADLEPLNEKEQNLRITITPYPRDFIRTHFYKTRSARIHVAGGLLEWMLSMQQTNIAGNMDYRQWLRLPLRGLLETCAPHVICIYNIKQNIAVYLRVIAVHRESICTDSSKRMCEVLISILRIEEYKK